MVGDCSGRVSPGEAGLRLGLKQWTSEGPEAGKGQDAEVTVSDSPLQFGHGTSEM